MMARNKAAALVDKAFKTQETILDDEGASPALRFKVSQDVLDRGGYPKFSASSSVNTTRVLESGTLKQEREELLAEYKMVRDERKQLEEAESGGKQESDSGSEPRQADMSVDGTCHSGPASVREDNGNTGQRQVCSSAATPDSG